VGKVKKPPGKGIQNYRSKNSKDVYGAVGNTSQLLFDPEDLVIVEDPKHPLYDERVNLPLSQALIANILHIGRVIEPVVVRKNPETGEVEVVAGRQRVRAVREINRSRKKDPLRVPAVVDRSKDDQLLDIIVSENEIRENDSPLVRAEKMRRLLGRGKTEGELSTLFGVSPQLVKNTLALLDATSAVKKAVDAGRISVNSAYKLAKMPADEQREKVAQLQAEAPTSPGKKNPKRRRAAEIVDGDGGMRGKKEIEKMLAELADTDDIKEGARLVATSVLEWVLGKGDLKEFYDVEEEGEEELGDEPVDGNTRAVEG
jgi:ParB family transcriptional regulator, chromosome partitioning protein